MLLDQSAAIAGDQRGVGAHARFPHGRTAAVVVPLRVYAGGAPVAVRILPLQETL
jgi:hypothetical protein